MPRFDGRHWVFDFCICQRMGFSSVLAQVCCCIGGKKHSVDTRPRCSCRLTREATIREERLFPLYSKLLQWTLIIKESLIILRAIYSLS